MYSQRATNMVSGEVFANTSASFLLNGTIDDLGSPFAAPTANTYLDKVQLYISTTTAKLNETVAQMEACINDVLILDALEMAEKYHNLVLVRKSASRLDGKNLFGVHLVLG